MPLDFDVSRVMCFPEFPNIWIDVSAPGNPVPDKGDRCRGKPSSGCSGRRMKALVRVVLGICFTLGFLMKNRGSVFF
jgi:hypothetical protein